MDKKLVYKMKFWNFELTTILPSTPSPFSVPAVTAFGGVSRGEAMGRVAAARYARREWFRSKFKIHFVNSIFLLLHGLKLKTLEYQTCSKFRDLQLSFQAKVHLSNGSKFNFFSHFCVATRKTLNTKVVRHLKTYKIGFG